MPNLSRPRQSPLKSARTFSTTTMVMVMALSVSVGSFVVAQSRAATTYTVSPGQSLSSAISQLKAGDTLIVKGGNYSGTVTASPAGTSAAPITVKAAAGENPVLTGLVRISNATYFTWDGVDVTWPSSAGSGDHMFKMTGGNNWRVTNSSIGDAHSYAAMLIAGTPSKWQVDHNYFHDTFKSNSTNQDHLIYANGGTGGGVITRNVFKTSPNGRGVKIGPPSGGTSPISNIVISYNTFYNNTGPSNIQLSYGASNNTIYRNLMVKSSQGNITGYNLNGSGNRAYENVGWESSAVITHDGGSAKIADGGGNIHEDPQLNTSTMLPGNAKFAAYGHKAPGDNGTVPTPSANPTPAPTPTPAPAADTTKPTATLTAPAAGSTLSGTVTLTANATDNVKVAKVDFLDGQTVVGTDATSPYSLAWNTATAGNGAHSLSARATDSAGNVTTSAVVAVTVQNSSTDSVSPSTPAGLTVSGTTATSVSLSWTAATDNVGVASYEIQRDGVKVGTSTGTTYTDEPLSSNTTYAYSVIAIDAAGNRSVPSATAMATTGASADTTAPSTPVGLQASFTNNRVTLSWAASTDNVGVKDYVVTRSGVTLGAVTATTITDAVLPTGSYAYVVVARDTSGNFSDPSSPFTVNLVSTADTQAPSVPTGLAAASIGTGEISLAWNPSSDNVGVASYEVWRDGDKLATVTTTSYGDATSAPGTTHVYSVVAVDAAGNRSAPSAGVSATTASNATAAAVTGYTKASTSSASSMTLARPSTVSAGTVLVATLDVRGQPTIDTPSGWTLLRKDVATTGSTMVKYTFARTAALSESSSYTFKFSKSSSATAVLAAVAGVKTTAKSTGKINASGTKITAPSVTLANGGVVLGLFGQANDAKVSAPSNMTKLGEVLNAGGSDSVSQLSLRSLPSGGPSGDETATSNKPAIGIGHLVALEQL